MKKWQKILLLVLAFAVAILGSSIVTMQLLTRGRTPAEDKAAEVSAYLDRFFIDDYDEDALADAAAAAMVEATGDRWSYYLTAEEKSSYDEQMQNAYVGIGVTITLQEQDGGMRVEQVTAGGPAEEAGMQVGDIITEVEGESTLTLGMAGTRAKVRGEEGTSVALTILRGGERLTLTVERRSIETAVATYEMLDDQIGYVKIANFDTRCFDETSAAIDALLDDGAQALIFDERNFQTAFTLSDGSMLNLSIGKYFTPNGRSLTDIGVTPDEPVELSDEDAAKLLYGQLAHADDAQLQAAIRAIRQKIS